MIDLLAALPEFFSTSAGIAVLALVVSALVIVIIALNYRLFMKSVFDFIFSLVAVIILSPVFIATAIIVKRRVKEDCGRVFTRTTCVGKKGKIIYVRSFSTIKGRLKNLPHLLDVLSGKLSIIGPKLVCAADAALIDDEATERFSVRPGLLSPVIFGGCETYDEMFVADVRYVKKRGLFGDIAILFRYLYAKLRGEDESYLGETARLSYAEALLKSGAITQADADTARAYAEEAENRSNPFAKY